MNKLFIQGVNIDWERIDEDSYLRHIEAIRELNELRFDKNITYEETDSYRITKMFIENKDVLLNRLLREERDSND